MSKIHPSNTIQEISFYSYWGKASKSDPENNFHLLPYHCLDVAAVANCYLDEHTHLLNSMASALGFSTEHARSLILFFIALHDLGKFSICFQSKVPGVLNKLLPGTKERTNTGDRHDVLGQVLWKQKLAKGFVEHYVVHDDKDDFIDGFNILMGATTGHHGEPTFTKNAYSAMAAFDSYDIEAATHFYSAATKLFLADAKFDLKSFEWGESFSTCCKRLSWWLSGLTILSDWLGSNTDYFQYNSQSSDTSFIKYWERANDVAKKAMVESGLKKIAIKSKQTFQTLFDKTELRPLQQQVAEIELNQQGQLFILEDITGAGKTEAALLLAYRMMEQGLADGIYFGLPTMATANGMYDRLSNLYKNFFDVPENVSIILAHANNKLAKQFHNSISAHPAEDKILEEELDTATTFCNAWLVDNRKKALLANVGVGTIDQALQSILPNKHQSLRLLGLFHKVLIVDEVHAYDPYMQELLQSLLKFHSASGGSVILLSATLPQGIRQKLVDAFFAGRGCEKKSLQKNDYPLLTQASAGMVTEISIQVLPELKREVDVRLCDNAEEIEKYIQEQLSKGRCVCWIRNTVHDAVEAYEKFKSIVSTDELTLFHARFTMQDRYAIEDKVKKIFGKNSTDKQRKGQLLIATQVVEQSLDLDFDCMVSDLAPIDLIIQRAGRLQRHNREPLRPTPLLLIYGPFPKDDITNDWYDSFFEKGKYVYLDHKQLWIGAKLLFEKEKLIMPDDARDLIEKVYSENNEITSPECLNKKADAAYAKQRANQDHGAHNACKLDNGYQKNSTDSWWSDARTPTRLDNENSINIYLAKLNEGQISPWCDNSEFAWQMSSLSTSLHRFEKLPEASLDFFNLSDNTKSLSAYISEMVEQLPDKGKYSALLIHDSITNQWALIENKELFRIYQIDYSAEKGLYKLASAPAEAGKSVS